MRCPVHEVPQNSMLPLERDKNVGSSPRPQSARDMTEIVLEPFSEFRFEVSGEQELKVYVSEGDCEILGQELLNERWYTFRNMKLFLYTLKGCRMRVEGGADIRYVSENTNVGDVVALFLEMCRSPKRLLVLGKTRSTVALTLLNLFARTRKKVIFTELDPGTGNLVFPGVLGSCLVDRVVEFSAGFDMRNMIAYFYGSQKISDREHYLGLLDVMSKKEPEYLQIILGPNDLELVERISRVFGVEKIVAVGNERLLSTVTLEVEKKNIGMSSGFVEDAASRKIHNYFYGRNSELTPFFISLRDTKILSKDNEMLAPETALPLGSTRKMRVNAVKEAEFQENFIMSIVDCSSAEDVLLSPSIGFLLSLEKEKLRVLSPQLKLPQGEKYLFRGDIKYFEG